MPKIVSATEVQNNYGAMAQWAKENQDAVIVENRGKPANVIISYDDYQETQRLREQDRRRKAVERMEAIRKRIAARNTDLTDEEIYRLAGFSEEVIPEMIANDQESMQGK